MVLPIYLVVRFFMALAAGVNVNFLHVAREIVRAQILYIADTPARFVHLMSIDPPPPPPFSMGIGFGQPIQLQYPELALRQRTPPPTRTSPGTPSTSAGRRIDVKPTAAPVTPSTPAPEATCFDLAERAPIASAKHWCPSLEIIAVVIDAIHSALALYALTYLPKLVVLAYTVCAYLIRRCFLYITPTLTTLPTANAAPVTGRARRAMRHNQKNRGAHRRARQARSDASLNALD